MNYNITGTTNLTCLLGSPVAHSISPHIHNEAFQKLGLDYAYLCFDVTTETLPQVVAGLKAMGVKGFNCTMPNKNLMYELADDVSPAARLIGAVNTVVNVQGNLIGHNTDGIGYMMSVKEAGHHIIGKKMTILGAGGSATAICAQAALDGVKELSIFSRRSRFWDRAVTLVNNINQSTSCQATLYDFASPSALKREIESSQILTNATSVGMSPNYEESLIDDISFFHKELIVSDIIYNPKETKLMKLAKKAGCQTFNGLYMLLFQGAEAFRLWTGKDMPLEHIKEKFFI
jgi:shikimate 5-dehydrogenase